MLDNITPPAELRRLHQWVLWKYETRDGKLTKPPYQGNGYPASSTDPDTWVSFDDALAAYHAGGGTFSGIGVVVREENGLVGIDLDHCVDPETGIEDWAQAIVDALDSYTEISPSGTGLRIFIYAKLPPDGRKRGNFECYSSGRYLTITGNQVPGTPNEVHSRQAELDAVHQDIFGEWLKQRNQVAVSATIPQPLGLDDSEILERAFKAKTGAAFRALYSGDASAYRSTSEADFALCCKILFWVAGDLAQADRIFRSSGLFRPKWDRRHGALTYGELTLTNALRGVTEFYSPTKSHVEPAGEPTQAIKDTASDLMLAELDAHYKQAPKDPNVADTVRTKTLVTVSATLTGGGTSHRARKKDSRWSDAVRLFPYQKGMKPLVKGTCLYSSGVRQLAFVDLLSNTWRNQINAQFKRRKIYFHVLPKLQGGPVFRKRVAIDDWSKKTHSALKRQLERADSEYLWCDNGLRRGYYLYLASVQLDGWELVDDVGAVLESALNGIDPPGREEDVERFRPYGGSRGWVGGAMAPIEDDAGKWHVIAQSETGIDWNQLEAELIAENVWYEQVSEFWKRSQWGPGVVADFNTEAEALDFAVAIGYAPTASASASSVPA